MLYDIFILFLDFGIFNFRFVLSDIIIILNLLNVVMFYLKILKYCYYRNILVGILFEI